MTASKNMLSQSFFERNFMFAINVSRFARILFLALKTLLSLSQTCGHTLSYHGICHRNFHSVTKRKFLRLNQCLRKNCADHPYKSEGKSSAKWQMTPPLLVICQEMLVSSWLLLSPFLLKWKGWCIITFSLSLALSTIFNAAEEWRCNLTVIKRIKLQFRRSKSCFRFLLG